MRIEEMVLKAKRRYNSLLASIREEEEYLGQPLVGGGPEEDTSKIKLFAVIQHDCHLAFTGNGSYYMKPMAIFTDRQEAENYAAEQGKNDSLLWEVFEVGA